MKVFIHPTIKRPWGPESPYTLIADDGQEYNGFLPKDIITEDDVIEAVNAFIAKREAEKEAEANVESIEATVVDRELIDLKAKVKKATIDAVKKNPTIDLTTLKNQVSASLGSIAGKMTEGFVDLYVKEAFDRGYIKEQSFGALKQFIVGKPKTEIEAIR